MASKEALEIAPVGVGSRSIPGSSSYGFPHMESGISQSPMAVAVRYDDDEAVL
jgi:hypothetical protein